MVEYDDYAAPQSESWVVTDIGKADWCMKKIAQAQKQIEDNQKFVQQEQERLAQWLEQANAEQNGTIEFMMSRLAPWIEGQIAGTKKKSFKLPHGTGGFKMKNNIVKDDEQILEYVKSNYPQFVDTKVTEKVNLVELKKVCTLADGGKLVTEDGEVVPGYENVVSNEFYVKPLMED